MVHLDSVVADTRGSGKFARLHINPGSAESSFREALMEYMIALVDVQAGWMESTTNKRKETNINARVV